MAINKKLIYCATKAQFNTKKAAGEFNNSSIVFIGDTGEMWTHNQIFGGTKFLPITGGTITGNLTINGAFTVTGTTKFSSTPSVNGVNVSLSNHTHNYAGSSSAGGAATRADFVKLTNQNLNDFTLTNYSGRSYYAAGGNTVLNDPDGLGSFGLHIWRVGDGVTAQLLIGDSKIYLRQHSSSTWSAWNRIMTQSDKIDSAISADKLTTTRTIWGQPFNGTQNVSGALNGVTTITGSSLVLSADSISLKYNGTDSKSVILNSVSFKPLVAANGAIDLGFGDSRWKTVYSVSINTTGAAYIGGELKAGAQAWKVVLASSGATNEGLVVVRDSANATVSYIRMGSNKLQFHPTGNDTKYDILHSGNYTTWVPTKTGSGASGTWGISITGNAHTVDNYHAGNASGNVPISNGTLNANLNADMVGGKRSGFIPGPLGTHALPYTSSDKRNYWVKIATITLTALYTSKTALLGIVDEYSTQGHAPRYGFVYVKMQQQAAFNNSPNITTRVSGSISKANLVGILTLSSTSSVLDIYFREDLAYQRGTISLVQGEDIRTNSQTLIATLPAGTQIPFQYGDISASTESLLTPRSINGTSFNGTADITTANWGTTRTLTIGNTGKSVNGSGNVSWSLAEIGAASGTHTHSYLPLSGGTLTNTLTIASSSAGNFTEGLRITSASNGWATITLGSTGTSGAPTNGWLVARAPSNQLVFTPGSSSTTTGLTLNSGGDAFWRNERIALAKELAAYLPLSGGAMTGAINSSVHTATYIEGNKGKAIINSTYGAGSYIMLAKMNSTNGYFTHGTYQNSYLLHYTSKATVDAGTNSTTKAVTLLNESGNSSFPGTVSAPNFSGLASRATVSAKLGRNGDVNLPMTFNWSGQSGQPTWLWGSNDGTTTNIYNPTNFSVANSSKLNNLSATSFIGWRGSNNYTDSAGLGVFGMSNPSSDKIGSGFGSVIQWRAHNTGDLPSTVNSSNWYNQIIGSTDGRIYFRTRTNGASSWSAVNKLLYATDTVSTAYDAYNVVGGDAGEILYQSSTGNTDYIGVGTNGQILTYNASTKKPYWASAPSNTDTLNTTGSTNSSSKLFLIGSTSQTSSSVTYSHDTAYVGTDGCVYSGNEKVSVISHAHGLLHTDLTLTLANTTTNTGWSMLNTSYNGFLLKSIRTQGSTPSWILNTYAAGICFGGSDTKGVMSLSYNAPSVRYAGGNGTAPIWYFTITGANTATYDLSNIVSNKLGTATVGSATVPIYLNAGSPATCTTTSGATANTLVLRDGSADLQCRLVRSNYANQSTISGGLAFRVNNSTDNYIRFCSDTNSIRTWLGVASSSHTHSYLPLSGGTLTGNLTGKLFYADGMYPHSSLTGALGDSNTRWAMLNVRTAVVDTLNAGTSVYIASPVNSTSITKGLIFDTRTSNMFKGLWNDYIKDPLPTLKRSSIFFNINDSLEDAGWIFSKSKAGSFTPLLTITNDGTISTEGGISAIGSIGTDAYVSAKSYIISDGHIKAYKHIEAVNGFTAPTASSSVIGGLLCNSLTVTKNTSMLGNVDIVGKLSIRDAEVSNLLNVGGIVLETMSVTTGNQPVMDSISFLKFTNSGWIDFYGLPSPASYTGRTLYLSNMGANCRLYKTFRAPNTANLSYSIDFNWGHKWILISDGQAWNVFYCS